MSCMTILFSKFANHQSRHQATSKMGCQPGDLTLKVSKNHCKKILMRSVVVLISGKVTDVVNLHPCLLVRMKIFTAVYCITQLTIAQVSLSVLGEFSINQFYQFS